MICVSDMESASENTMKGDDTKCDEPFVVWLSVYGGILEPTQ